MNSTLSLNVLISLYATRQRQRRQIKCDTLTAPALQGRAHPTYTFAEQHNPDFTVGSLILEYLEEKLNFLISPSKAFRGCPGVYNCTTMKYLVELCMG